MASGSRVCPHCGALNAVDEKHCFRCKRRLPSALTEGLGGAVRGLLGESWPMTRFFVLLCVGVYFIMTFVAMPRGDPGALLRRLWALPNLQYLRWGALPYDSAFPSGLGRSEPWRFVAAIFVHMGVLHIVFNTSALLYYGRLLEEKIGSARFTIAFFVTGVLGFLVSDLWYARPEAAPALSAGASGAIFGIIGALVGYLFGRRDPEYRFHLMSAVVMGVIAAVVFSVNNAAHIGGFVTGLPLGLLVARERRPERIRWLVNVLAALAVVTSIGSLILVQRSPWWRLAAQEQTDEER